MTPAAAEKLAAGLLEVWNSRPGRGRLTREEKARLLGVSVVTADRILGRERVDKSSLVLAFQSLGLEWSESFYERPGNPYPDVPASVGLATNGMPESRRRLTWALAVAGLLVTLLIGLRPLVVNAAFELSTAWHKEFKDDMTAGTYAYHDGDYERARMLVDRATLTARKQGSAPALSWSLKIQGELLAQKGDFSAALDRFVEAGAFLMAMENTVSLGPLLEVRGNTELRLGKLADADNHFRQALELARTYGHPVNEAAAYRGLGSVAAARKRWAESDRWFQSALRTLAKTSETNMAVDVRARMATTWSARGRHARALQELADCLTHWEARRHVRWIATTRLQLGSVSIASGEVSEGLRLVQMAREGFASIGDRAGESDCDVHLNEGPHTTVGP